MKTITNNNISKKSDKIVQDIALVEAIHEGLGTEQVKREEIFKLLEDKKPELPLLL